MQMPDNLAVLLSFFTKTIETTETLTKKGRPYVYPSLNLLYFFIVMQLKGIHHFKTMSKYIAIHHLRFGLAKAPSRKTLRRRFLEMPGFVRWLLPCIARELSQMDQRYRLRVGFVDKSVFAAFGGIWHKKHMQQGVVPHKSIDTDASWAKSAYHGWRFGYGLHIVVNAMRMPLQAVVTTAQSKDTLQVYSLLNGLRELHIIVADAGYRSIRFLVRIWKQLSVFVLTNKPFETVSKAKKWYNRLWQKDYRGKLYKKRKPSVEPAFSLIKNLFKLEGKNKLPYKGLPKVSAYLMVCVAAIQFLIVFNFIFNH